jgi:hypothetical protein
VAESFLMSKVKCGKCAERNGELFSREVGWELELLYLCLLRRVLLAETRCT